MAWQGKILRVDLSAGTCTDEPLDRGVTAKYLGQRGLATRYLMSEIDPRVDPLEPGNKLIFATGPLTGTPAPTGGRYSVITKGALTGAIACSNSGGYFGAELKFAGWDMLIVEGRAAQPVYLFIEDDRAEILPAGELWGKSVWETEPAIRAIHGDPQIRIASIGRAGEALARLSCIMNDMDRAAGRSGVGAVMGSKNLKAIAVRGHKGFALDDSAAFMEANKAVMAKLVGNPDVIEFARLGTNSTLGFTQEFGTLPTRNNRDVQFEGARHITGEAMLKVRPTDGKPNLLTNKACFACPIGCARVSKMDRTHFSVAGRKEYWGASGGLEYEAAYALGSMVGVSDMEAATFANFVCNEDGMDPISFGSTLGAAMELYDIGALTSAETGGLALEFGSAEALVKAVELTGKGEGFGLELGLGAKLLCEKYGRPELAMVSKGQEFAGFDGRTMQGMGLAYATSNRGACHVRANPYGDDFKKTNLEGKAAIVKNTQDEQGAVDSSGLCMFVMMYISIEDLSQLLDAACQGDWSVANLRHMGERIWNLERQFNLAAGLTAADDTLPKRILSEPAPSGTNKGQVSRLPEMLPEYYALRGWTAEGVPTDEMLGRLDL
jgi:aldehyde:ferredoxin oxidoreductase